MNRKQQLPKLANITCHGCGKVVPRQDAFYMYEFECCSNECIEPLRKQRQAEELLLKEERESKRARYGAFTFSNGGASAH